MLRDSTPMACTGRHFSETGKTLAFSLIAFELNLFYLIFKYLSMEIFGAVRTFFGIFS